MGLSTPVAEGSTSSRFTSFRFTLEPTPEQDERYRQHAGAARMTSNQVVALYLEAKQAKRVCEEGASEVWVPVTPLQCIDVFNKWKKVPAVGGVATGEGQGKVTLCGPGGRAEVEPCLLKLDDADRAARKHQKKDQTAFRLPWMADLYQCVLEEAAKDAGAALTARKKWFAGERRGPCPGPARFKKKGKCRPSFRIRNQGQKVVRFRPMSVPEGQGIPHRAVALPDKLGGVVNVRECTRRLRRLLAKPDTRLNFVTIAAVDGRWTMTVNLETGPLHPADRVVPEAEPRYVGIDRGLKTLAVLATAEGTEVERVDPPRPLREGLSGLRRSSRSLSKKVKGSANWRRARRRLQRRHARIRRVREDFVRRLASRWAKSHGYWVLESLNTKGLMRSKRRGMARALADSAWARLATRLKTRVSWHGGVVIEADRFFPSTRRCSDCGHVNEALALDQRVFCCTVCGFEADRDTNAATNLAQFPNLPLPTSEKPSGAGYA